MLLSMLFLFLSNPRTIIFIIFILVLFFGAKRIPELFKGVGQGVREFKDASNGDPQPPMSQPYNNQQPQQYNPNGYPQQPQQYNPNGYPQQPQQYSQGGYPQQPQQYGPPATGQVPQTPYNSTNNNSTNTPAS